MEEQLEYSINLESLHLENFRCFQDLNIKFDERLTVFIAENGGGKTAILDIIAEGLKAYLAKLGIEGYTKCSFKATDVNDSEYKSENELSMRLDYPIQIVRYEEKKTDKEVEVVLSESEMDTKTELNVKSHISISKDDDSSFDILNTSIVDSYKGLAKNKINREAGKNIILPVLAYYGGSGLDMIREVNKKPKNRLQFLYKDALTNSRINFTAFHEWFEKEYKLYLQDQVAEPEKTMQDIAPNLYKIRTAIETVLNDKDTKYKDLGMDYTNDETKIVLGKKNDSGKYDYFSINQFSMGEKSLFAFVADLGFRLLKANPVTKVDEDGHYRIHGKGIVLIDEVDLHLHPKWQRSVIDKLMEIFPDVQFVMSTHSPFILSNVHTEQARVIKDNKCFMVKEVLPDFVNYGANLEKIVTLLFGLSDYMPKEVSDLFDAYFKAINEEDFAKAKDFEKQLVALTDVNHPKLIEGRAEIEFKQLISLP